MTTQNAQTGTSRMVDGAHDWFINTLNNLVAPNEMAELAGRAGGNRETASRLWSDYTIDDLAEVMDGDREKAATVWTRFTKLTSRAQVYLQTLQGEDALRAWLESIIIYGSEGEDIFLGEHGLEWRE